MNMDMNLIIVGVGGQGILLTSKILGYLALREGEDVKVSEVHGMSQRGGSVITHVRIGRDVHAPLVAAGEADVVLSFEWLEALRAAFYLKKDGLLITNSRRMLPMPVILGKADYPGEAPACGRVLAIDAQAQAEASGSVRCVNTVLLGVLSRLFSWPLEDWKEAITACVKPATLAANLDAFERGRAAGDGHAE